MATTFMADQPPHKAKDSKEPSASIKTEEPIFYLVIKTKDGESVRAATEAEILKLTTEHTEIFAEREEAERRKRELTVARVTRTHQVLRARAKVARQRAEFAARHPEAAADLKMLDERARLAEQALLASRAK